MAGALGDMPIVDHNEKKIGTLNQPVISSRSDLVAFFYPPALEAAVGVPIPSTRRHIGAALVDIGSPPLSSTESSNACISVTSSSPGDGQ